MSDRELLELAAKAASIDIDWSDFLDRGSYIAYRVRQSNRCWNALADDGDALRLVVKLGILDLLLALGELALAEGTDLPGDTCAKVRRAIVRAAAEIGRAK